MSADIQEYIPGLKDRAVTIDASHIVGITSTTSLSPATKVVAQTTSGFVADYYTDGIADDIQINAALAAAAGGSVVIKAGSYYVMDDLLIPSSTSVKGEGIGNTIIYQQASKGFKNSNYLSTGNNHIAISDLTIDGQTVNDVCIQYRGVQNGLIERVEVRNIRSVNLPIASVAIGIVGLSGVETREITVRGCYLNDCGNYGINMDPLSTFEVVKNIVITGNQLYNVETGAACQRNCQNVIVSQNVYEYAQGGVCIGFKGCPGSDDTHPGQNIQIINNVFKNADTTATSQGISIGNSNDHCIVQGNTIQNFETAIYLNVHPNYTQVLGNNIYGSTYGIRDNSGAEFTICNGNSVYNCSEYGLWFNTSVQTISNNVVRNCGKHGIYLQSSADGVIVFGNKVDHNGTQAADTYSGIYLEDITNGIIASNYCTDTSSSPDKVQHYGIVEAATSDLNTFTGNNCRANISGTLLVIGASSVYGNNIGF